MSNVDTRTVRWALAGALMLAAAGFASAQQPAASGGGSRQAAPVAAPGGPAPLGSEDRQEFVRLATQVARLVDAGQMGEMWGAMSTTTHARGSKAEFVAGLERARGPAGAFQSRQAVAVDAIENPPEAALRGRFVNVRFRSSFSQLPQATELVSFHKDEDGQWRVTGYALIQ